MKIWGFFAQGRLFYSVLPAAPRRPKKGAKKTAKKAKGAKPGKDGSTNMTGTRYQALVRSQFQVWASKCWGPRKPRRVLLVQDHERCLWAEDSLRALKEEGFDLLKNFPKSSPDLNHIEGVWHLLRQELDKGAPTARETRAEFLGRLRRTVARMNDAGAFAAVAENQKERATEVLELKGAKTRW